MSVSHARSSPCMAEFFHSRVQPLPRVILQDSEDHNSQRKTDAEEDDELTHDQDETCWANGLSEKVMVTCFPPFSPYLLLYFARLAMQTGGCWGSSGCETTARSRGILQRGVDSTICQPSHLTNYF
eukprot:2658085-Pleurochrysis_carterae.AAC.1